MAMIPMTSGFTLCPKGVQVFRIYKVDYNEEFGKLTIHLVNAQGITHQERFSLMKADGTMNEGACGAFSFFAKTALNDFTIEAVDPATLVNHYIKADVVHTEAPSTKDPNKMVTFANLGDKWEADGFDTTPVPKALTLGNDTNVAPAPAPQTVQPTAPTPAPATTGLDLNALLNG
jgi:hypothetical protein